MEMFDIWMYKSPEISCQLLAGQVRTCLRRVWLSGGHLPGSFSAALELTLVLVIFGGTAMLTVEVTRVSGHLAQNQRYGETAVIVICD